MAALLPALLAGTVLGVVASDGGVPVVVSPVVVVVAIAAVPVALLFRRRWLLLIAAVIGGVAIASRAQAVALPTGPGTVAAAIGEETWTVEGTVTDDPRPRGERQQVVLDQVTLARGDVLPRPAAGCIQLWLPRGLLVAAGDRLHIDSGLEQPEDFEGFAYRAYLGRQGIAAGVQVALQGQPQGAPFLAIILGEPPDQGRHPRGWDRLAAAADHGQRAEGAGGGGGAAHP